MQTFLPYPDFIQTARCLDYRRLGKQRVEAWQIYQTLQKVKERNNFLTFFDQQKVMNGSHSPIDLKPKISWENHPAVLMWKGYESALLRYTLAMINEWKDRGYRDNMKEKVFMAMQIEDLKYPINSTIPYPLFIGDELFHSSHRSNLLRKDKDFYSKYGWTEPDDLPYIWKV